LASRYLDAGDTAPAVKHAEAAVRLDPEYSAAWKALGRALTAAGRTAEAEASYARGIAVAERRGDQQAAKEMRVFAKRLQRAAGGTPQSNDD
jgi:Tfp pilus assembly protein PilF